MSRGIERIDHPTLRCSEGTPFHRTDLKDQQKLGVLLEGCALLAHLARVGWRLADDWQGAVVSKEARLVNVRVEPGRRRGLTQHRLSALLLRLFSIGEPPLAGCAFAAPGAISGRGPARRAARQLAERWRQGLVEVSADQALVCMFDEAPILWRPSLAAHRESLVGRFVGVAGAELWVAGPAGSRRGLLRESTDLERLIALVREPAFRDLWETERTGFDGTHAWVEAGEAGEVAEAGPSASPSWALPLQRAQEAYRVGAFRSALKLVENLVSAEATLLRAQCALSMGDLRSARRRLADIRTEPLSAAQRLVLARLRVRIHSCLGERVAARKAGAVVLRLARGTAGEHAASAFVLLTGLDGRAAGRLLYAVLGTNRRGMSSLRASQCWVGLAWARLLIGDRNGARRGFGHAFRLSETHQSKRAGTEALVGMAAVRLREGETEGIEDLLQAVRSDAITTGHRRMERRCSTLLALLDLTLGSFEAAEERCCELSTSGGEADIPPESLVLRVIRARALGCLARKEAAAEELGFAGSEALGALDPEERPAIWALAGESERALQNAATGPFGPLWRKVVCCEPMFASDWDALMELHGYRQARLVFDLVVAGPERMPDYWLRRALSTFSRLHLRGLEASLRTALQGPWLALRSYLHGERADRTAIETLFAGSGYRDVRLVWSSTSREVVLVDGPGGAEEIKAPLNEGHLALLAPRIGEELRTLFEVVVDRVSIPQRTPAADRGGMVGESAVLAEAVAKLRRFAVSDVPVLLLGESGTGKELAAKHVHASSSRAGGPFLAYNCAAVTDSLLLADLFGHVRGAFTGADRDRSGFFEAARGGTVLLDEIGDLPASAQGSLLRVLQEGEIRRVGESRPRRVDVRVVAATHRDLESMVEEGSFRRDLYFRLRVAQVVLPPLRQRGADVLLLAEHFLSRAGKGCRLTRRARERLLGHFWQGNVRELFNVLQVALTLTDDRWVRCRHLDIPEKSHPEGGIQSSYHQQLDAYRRRLLSEALEATHGHRVSAARRLGITRQALSYLLRKLEVADPTLDGSGVSR